jgi:hypothetical protein
MKVSKGQNIFDIAIQEYGNAAEGLLQLWRDNPGADLLNADLAAGLELSVDEDRVDALVLSGQGIAVTVNPPVAPVVSKKIRVSKGQNLFDVALSEFGGVEAVIQLWRDNPSADLLSADLAGLELLIDITGIINQPAVDSYKDNGLVNTGSQLIGIQQEEGIFDETFDETFE